jgi:hypothetical protein
MMRIIHILVLALVLQALEKAQAFEGLMCKGRNQAICSSKACEQDELFTDLVFITPSLMELCIGEGCYQARFTPVTSDDGSVLFAFDARHNEQRSRFSGLVTLHPGRNVATLGQFLDDGRVVFSFLICDRGAVR